MRALIAFLLIAAAAVTLALLFRLNTGYVLFVAPPYRVELSQNAFIIISVLAFLALYALIRAGVRLAKLPELAPLLPLVPQDVWLARAAGQLIAVLARLEARADWPRLLV